MKDDIKYEYQHDVCVALIVAAQAGDASALEALFVQYQNLLCATAKRYQSTVSYEDAYQEACLAFMQCIAEYQIDRAIPFPAYARAIIRGDVRTAMRRLWRYDARMDCPRDGDGSGVDGGLRLGVTGVSGGGLMSRGPVGATRVEVCGDGVSHADVDARMDWDALFAHARLSRNECVYAFGMMDGWTPTELAHRHSVSVQTVRTWRKRAIAKLRPVLRAWLDDGGSV